MTGNTSCKPEQAARVPKCQPPGLSARARNDGRDLAKLYDCALILLDSDLPDMSGQAVLRSLRLAKVETPILILSGHDATDSKIGSVSTGADDYLTPSGLRGRGRACGSWPRLP